MREEWLKLRNRLLFKTSVSQFASECELVRKSYEQEYAEAKCERKEEIVKILSEIAIDMQSYLCKWHLQVPGNNEQVGEQAILKESDEICRLLIKLNHEDKVKYILEEVNCIQKSNLFKLSNMADEKRINNRWGNDSAWGLTASVRRGAILSTTNPVMVNNIRKVEPEIWDKVKQEIKKKHLDADPDKLIQYFTMAVVRWNAEEFRPIFEATGGKYGYVSLQVNPKNSENTAKMIEEAEFLYKQLKEELDGVPNVIFKIPGTQAAFPVVERLTAQGIGVNITASCSIGQFIKFGEIIEKGTAKVSFITMMSGRFDDPIREELIKAGVDDAGELAKNASQSVIRRAYDILYRKKKMKKCRILIASMRGPWNIESSITDEDTPILISVFPDKAAEYDSTEREIISRIAEKTPDSIISLLMQSKIFRQGYEPDGMTYEEFSEFYPVDATLKSFSQNYDETKEYMLS